MEFLNKKFNQLLSPFSTPKPKDIDTNPCSTSNIIRTALILSQKLPTDLVPIILDYAKLWVTVESAQSIRSDRVGEQQSPKLQVALIVPSFIPRGSVRRVKFSTRAQARGWSSSHRIPGRTWFEAGIRGLDPSNEDDQRTLLAPVDCQHRNGLDPEHRELCMANVARYKYGSRRIVTNSHHSTEFVRRQVEWEVDGGDVEISAALRELAGGHRIEVAACAEFPDWCNYVESVDIRIECAVVRKM